MVIVDTTVWVDYLNGADNPETERLDREVEREEIGLTDLILCEELQGVRSGREFTSLRKQRGLEMAVEAAENFSRAAKARVHGTEDHRLLDRDILHTRGLRSAAPRP